MFELGVQNNVVYKYPRDKEITKTLNTIFLPQGTKIKVDGEPVKYSRQDITLAEATPPLLAKHGLNLSMVTYQPQKVTFKNGAEIRREDDGALRQPVETEQHVVVEDQRMVK